MRKLAAVAALVAAVGVGTVAVAAEANAAHVATTTGVITLPATSYTSPSNVTTPVHYGLQPGQTATVVCFTEGQNINGNSYWFRIGLDGRLGFVNRGSINVPAEVPHC